MSRFLITAAIVCATVLTLGSLKQEPKANASPSFIVTEKLPATVKPAVLTPQVKHDIKPAVKHTTLVDLESHEVADILPVEPVQAQEVVAKAAPAKAAAKKCCEDCNCRGECNCSYPGECLINSAKPKNCRVLVQNCHGGLRQCELHEYWPRDEDGKTLSADKVPGTWRLFRTDRPHHWDRTEYTVNGAFAAVRTALSAVRQSAPVQWFTGGCANGNCGNTFRGCVGGRCSSCR